jgi:hypothetical protein
MCDAYDLLGAHLREGCGESSSVGTSLCVNGFHFALKTLIYNLIYGIVSNFELINFLVHKKYT